MGVPEADLRSAMSEYTTSLLELREGLEPFRCRIYSALGPSVAEGSALKDKSLAADSAEAVQFLKLVDDWETQLMEILFYAGALQHPSDSETHELPEELLRQRAKWPEYGRDQLVQIWESWRTLPPLSFAPHMPNLAVQMLRKLPNSVAAGDVASALEFFCGSVRDGYVWALGTLVDSVHRREEEMGLPSLPLPDLF